MMRQHEGTPLEVVYDSERIAEVRAELDRALEGWKRIQMVRDAAPVMLEALRVAEQDQQFAVEWMRRERMSAGQIGAAIARLANTRAAIAKATGGANA